jgi:hypothetical protein
MTSLAEKWQKKLAQKVCPVSDTLRIFMAAVVPSFAPLRQGPRAVCDLVCHDLHLSVERRLLVAECRLFDEHPALLEQSYVVQSRVSPDALCIFVSAINGENVVVTNENALSLYLLCREFGFGRLGDAALDHLVQSGLAIDVHPEVDPLAQKIADLTATVAELRQANEELTRRVAAHDDLTRRLPELIHALLAMVKCCQPFLIIVRINGEEQAVAATGEKELSDRSEENYRFTLEKPDWSKPAQQFRFGEGGESEAILSVWKPGHALDQAYGRKGNPFLFWPKRGPNQHFEYRPRDRRLICKVRGDAVTAFRAVPPLVHSPAAPSTRPTSMSSFDSSSPMSPPSWGHNEQSQHNPDQSEYHVKWSHVSG